MAKRLFLLFSILSLFALFLVFSPPAQAGMIFASFFFFTLAVFLSTWGKKPSAAIDELGLLPKKGQSIARLALWGLAAAVACAIVAEGVSLLLYFFGLLDSQLVQSKMLSFPPSILLFAVTLAPLAEESLFRGVLFKKVLNFTSATSSANACRLHLPFIASALLSSALFALLHLGYGSIAEIIVAFSIGIVLCIATFRTNSLIPAVIAHACFNLAAITFTVLI